MKRIKKGCIIAFVVLEIVVIIATILSVMNVKPQPTQEDYNTLKEYCRQIAFGTPIEEIEKKEVKPKKEIKENSIEVSISTQKCKVIAIFPLIEEEAFIENGILYQEIDYDNVSYKEESFIADKSTIILRGICIGALCLILAIAFFDVVLKDRKT